MGNSGLLHIVGINQTVEVPVDGTAEKYTFEYKLSEPNHKEYTLFYSIGHSCGSRAAILASGKTNLQDFEHGSGFQGHHKFRIENADKTQVGVRYLGFRAPRGR